MKFQSNVKIDIHTTRTRLNADGSRTILDDSHSSRAITVTPAAISRAASPFLRRVALVMAAIGAVQLGYGAWASWSDAAAARVFRTSPSCDLAALAAASAVPTTSGECRLEDGVVVGRDWRSRRGGKQYYLTILSPDGRRENTNLPSGTAVRLWFRVAPTQRIMIQRFVVPGYHLTGSITALTDGHGVAMSDVHPDAGTHYAALNIALGVGLLVLGLMSYARRR